MTAEISLPESSIFPMLARHPSRDANGASKLPLSQAINNSFIERRALR